MNKPLDIELHLRSFAEAFVASHRKDTWTYLLCERPDYILMHSSKLFNHLDHNYIKQNDPLNHVAPYDTVGVFYNFKDEPKCISFKEAIEEGKIHDGVFSIIPGELAVYLSDEDWNFVCKR